MSDSSSSSAVFRARVECVLQAVMAHTATEMVRLFEEALRTTEALQSEQRRSKQSILSAHTAPPTATESILSESAHSTTAAAAATETASDRRAEVLPAVQQVLSGEEALSLFRPVKYDDSTVTESPGPSQARDVNLSGPLMHTAVVVVVGGHVKTSGRPLRPLRPRTAGSQTVSQFSERDQHECIVFMGSFAFSCTECNKGFNRQYILKKHQLAEHPEIFCNKQKVEVSEVEVKIEEDYEQDMYGQDIVIDLKNQHSEMDMGLKNQHSEQDMGLKNHHSEQDMGLKNLHCEKDMGLKNQVNEQDMGLNIQVNKQDMGLKREVIEQDMGLKNEVHEQDMSLKHQDYGQDIGLNNQVNEQDIGLNNQVNEQDMGLNIQVNEQDMGLNIQVNEQDMGLNIQVHEQDMGLNIQVHEHLSEVDDSLASLQWLQDFVVGANSGGPQPGGGPGREPPLSGHRHQPPPPLSVPVALSPLAGDMASVGNPPVLPTPVVVMHGYCPGGVDADEKPTQSCSTLLFMAIQGSERGKLTLSAIYEWFRVNFSYYRCTASTTWMDTIRHTLSVNKGFIKLPKEKGESGKGRFWTVDPQHVDHFRCDVDKVQIDLWSGSQQLPGHSDEVTCGERNLPSQAVSGRKRKRPQASPTSLAKVTRRSTRSSSQLLRGD